MCREETVDDGIGGGVKGCQTLYECCDCGVGSRGRNVSKHLQEIEHYVGTPAEDEHWRNRERDRDVLGHTGGLCDVREGGIVGDLIGR